MARTFQTFLSRLVRGSQSQEQHVHFHRGPQGQPAACHDSRCDLPRLSVE
jgi:hypothetical protein